MPQYRRRLPHIYEIGQPVFVTWSLQGSLPPGRYFPGGALESGCSFAAMDRLLDETRRGPMYLRQFEAAEMIVEAIQYNSTTLRHYALNAFTVMPNHVHMLITPKIPLPTLLKSLKGITAKRANEFLHLTGKPFWSEESYDHLVRDRRECERIQFYIENNPVRAGLVGEMNQYRWSSAWGT